MHSRIVQFIALYFIVTQRIDNFLKKKKHDLRSLDY